MQFKIDRFILLVIITVIFTGHAWSQVNWVEVGVQIKKGYDNIMLQQEMIDYSQDFADAVKNDKPIPTLKPKISGGKTLIQRIDELQEQLDEIDVPAEESSDAPSLPTVEQIASSDAETVRTALNQAVENVSGRAKQLQALKEANENINNMVSMSEATDKSVRLLANAFEEIIEKAALAPLINLFGFAWYDLEANFSPKVGNILSTAKKKQKMLASALDVRSKGFANLVGNINTLLAAEAQHLDAAILERKGELDKTKEAAKKIQDELQPLIAFLEEEGPLLEQEENEINEEGNAYNKEYAAPLEEEQKVLKELEQRRKSKQDTGITSEEWNQRVNALNEAIKKATGEFEEIEAKQDKHNSRVEEYEAKVAERDELDKELTDLNLKCDSVQADIKRLEANKTQNQQNILTLSNNQL